MEIFDAQRLILTLTKLNNQITKLSGVMETVEAQVDSLGVQPTPAANNAALPSTFSNIAFSNTVLMLDDFDLGPDVVSTFSVNTAIQEDEIVSYPFTVNTTPSNYRLTIEPSAGAEEPITFWVSTEPGGPSIVQNQYITNKAMATNVSTSTTYELSIGTINTNEIYTRGYIIANKTYWLNATYNTYGNFNRNIMVPNYTVPAGPLETSIEISGEII